MEVTTETKTAFKTQLVWKQSNKRIPPLKPFKFEDAVEGDRAGEPNGVSVEFSELSVMDGREKEELANVQLSEKLLEEGNALAEIGKFGEALGKWETAIFLTPRKALLHEQKAQVLLEIGKPWSAVQAATSATLLQPTWTDAWVTLARAQLNYGEPYLAVESARTALELEPNHEDANIELERAQFLAVRQRQATRESSTSITAAQGVLPNGQNRLPSCRRAKVFDSDDTNFGEEHPHQVVQLDVDMEIEKESGEEKLFDKYDDDTYDWVDEVFCRKPPQLTDEDLLSDFSDI